MALYRLPAIVLRTHPFQDTHYIVTLFSPTRGKIRAIAKGARRIQSSLGRLVQPMVYAIFQLAEGKNLDVMTQGVLKTVFPKVRADLQKLTHGLYALELIDRLIEEPESNPPLFFLLLKTLEGLDAGNDASASLRVFEAHLFRFLGYAPAVEHCIQCETLNFGVGVKFSSRLGGILCERCAEQDKLAVGLTPELLRAMRACFSSPPGETPSRDFAATEEVGKIFQRYFEEKGGKKMHGFHLLAQVHALDMSLQGP